MEEGRPSTTARRVAMLRAAHQILDDPKVLDDPIALRIIDPATEVALRGRLPDFRTPRLQLLRASMVMRSRYAEDRLAEAVARGVRQYVILGAGLDTFPYRNPFPESALHVFEVDYPATQVWKRRRLEAAGLAIPPTLTFVPIDFERETLENGLAGAGFRRDQPTFFSWLGVTMYLSREAVTRTLEWVAAGTPSGSEIVFSYVVSASPLAQRAAALGEPWKTYFDPPALMSDLTRMGFGQVEDFGPEEANRRYFANRADGLHIGGTGRHMAARV